MVTIDLNDTKYANEVYLTDCPVADINTSDFTYTATSNLASNSGTRFARIFAIKFETSVINEPFIMPSIQNSGEFVKDNYSSIMDLRSLQENITVDGYFVNVPTDTAENQEKNLSILAGIGHITDNDSKVNRGGTIHLIFGSGDSQILREGLIINYKVDKFPATIGDQDATSLPRGAAYKITIAFTSGKELEV